MKMMVSIHVYFTPNKLHNNHFQHRYNKLQNEVQVLYTGYLVCVTTPSDVSQVFLGNRKNCAQITISHTK